MQSIMKIVYTQYDLICGTTDGIMTYISQSNRL